MIEFTKEEVLYIGDAISKLSYRDAYEIMNLILQRLAEHEEKKENRIVTLVN